MNENLAIGSPEIEWALERMQIRLGDYVEIKNTCWRGRVSAIDRHHTWTGSFDFLVAWHVPSDGWGDQPNRLTQDNIVSHVGEGSWLIKV